jgi:hypothetical protein
MQRQRLIQASAAPSQIFFHPSAGARGCTYALTLRSGTCKEVNEAHWLAGSSMFGNQADTNNDFDLLRGAPRQDNQSNEQCGIPLTSSKGPGPSLTCAYLRTNSGNQNRAQNFDAPQPYGLHQNLPCHSLAGRPPSCGSAGVHPPVSGAIRNNPFNTGLIHNGQGYPLHGHMHGSSQGISETRDGNMSMLTCAGVPGMRGNTIGLTAEANPGRSYAVSMPQVPQVHPRHSPLMLAHDQLIELVYAQNYYSTEKDFVRLVSHHHTHGWCDGGYVVSQLPRS